MRCTPVTFGLLLLATVAASPGDARADIDASGPWRVVEYAPEIGTVVIIEHWTQTGTTLMTGNTLMQNGTIDPVTGAFSETFILSPLLAACMLSTRSGVVAADGRSFSATAELIAGITPTLCHTPIEALERGTRCGTGTLEAGEACDDGNVDNGDGCDANCQIEPCFTCSGEPSACVPAPNGASCGDACTTASCDAGVCVPSSTLSCDDGSACTVDACDPQTGCQHSADLRVCRGAAKSTLLLHVSGSDNDKLTWKWLRGDATSQADFADPRSSASYTFCLYAGTAVASEAVVPPSATAWSASGSNGFSYADASAAADGVRRIQLKGGDAGRAKVVLKARGPGLAASAPPLALPLTAQLRNGDTEVCWIATFGAGDVSRNDTGRLKARRIQ